MGVTSEHSDSGKQAQLDYEEAVPGGLPEDGSESSKQVPDGMYARTASGSDSPLPATLIVTCRCRASRTVRAICRHRVLGSQGPLKISAAD